MASLSLNNIRHTCISVGAPLPCLSSVVGVVPLPPGSNYRRSRAHIHKALAT
jgi:hypothetical protein